MTNINWNDFPPIPGFDCVEWKRQRQAQIFEETKHMTLEERRERSHQASKRAALRRKEFAKQRTVES